jgi:hypothetical protein
VSNNKSSEVNLVQRATAAIGGKRFLSEGEVESIYDVPKKTLQGMRLYGRGPIFRKFGSRVRYDVADIEAWIESLPRGGAGVPSSAVKETRRFA